MTTAALTGERGRTPLAGAAMKGAAALWFVIAFVGQAMFALYIGIYYGRAAAMGDWAQWNKRLITGFVDGDIAGNFALVAHIALAFVITFCGPLQFVPAVRRRAIGFHRWNGRIYITTAFVISLGALYLVNTRGAGAFNTVSIQINAALIMLCAAMTLRSVLARRIDAHYRWALRTFLLVSGVWFLRVGYTFVGILFQGDPPGVSENLNGPTDIALAYLSFFLPIAVLQLYFIAKDRGGNASKWAMTGVLALAAAVTGVGVAGLIMFAWLPKIVGGA